MNRTLVIDEEIFINQYNQGLHSLLDMDEWFLAYGIDDKRDILHNLLIMVIQAKSLCEDIEAAALSLGTMKSASAVKLLNPNKPFGKFGYEICSLPEKELLTGFNILINTLKIADTRRKLSENPDLCRHWWHKDLSEESYLSYLKSINKQ